MTNVERSSALPEALRGVFTEEPRHIDVRWADGRLGLTLNDLESETRLPSSRRRCATSQRTS